MAWALSQSEPKIDVWPVGLPDTPDQYTLKTRVVFRESQPGGLPADPPWVVEVWLDDGAELIGRGSSAGYGADTVDITTEFEPVPEGREVALISVRNDAVGQWSIAIPATRG